MLIQEITTERTRRIARNTAMLYVRMLFIMLVTLYTSRVVLEELRVVDFGIYNVVGGVVMMFSFLNGSMSGATQRFLSFELGQGNREQLKKVFDLSVTLHSGIALVIFLLAETVGLWFLNTQLNIPTDRMEAARWVYQFSIFSFMVSVIQVPYNAMIIANEKMSIYAYISVLEVALKLFVVFMLDWLNFDKLKLYAVLIFGVTLVVMLIYRCYCKSKYKECTYHLIWDKDLFKILTGFAGWNLFGGLAWLGKSQGVNLLLNIFFGTVVNAAYGIANQVNTAVNSFVQNFMTALNPQIIKSYACRDMSYLLSLLFRGARFSYYLLFILTLPLLFQTEFVLRVWLGKVPEYSVIFTQLVLLNSLLEVFAYVLGTAVQATGRNKWYQIIVGITILLNIPFSYLFLKFGYTPVVVFWVSITITLLSLLQRLLILRKYIPFSFSSFLYKVFGNIISVTCIAVFLPLLFMYHLEPGDMKSGVVIGCTGISALLSVVFVGLNRGERIYIFKAMKVKFRKEK